MPMPSPKKDEKKEEFLDRCMGDEVMNDEYPDKKQRYAVCLSIWEKDKEGDKKSKEPKREVRTFELDMMEVRSEEGESKKIRGHAAVFDKLSEDLGGFREIIERGSFVASIKKDDIRALFNHDPNYILGRNKAKTLILNEDEQGLYYEIEPPDTQYARDLMVSIERGDVNQCSFAFNIEGKNGEKWFIDGKEVNAEEAFGAFWDENKHEIVRHVIKAKLYDVSPVTYPAYPQTDVKVRSLLEGAGIDSEKLAGAVESARRGEISDEDRKTIEQSIEILSGYIEDAPKQADGGAQDNGLVERLAGIRRQLEIVELS